MIAERLRRWRALARPQARLLAAAALLAAALANPTVPGVRALFQHLVVLDITQSMDVRDMTLDGTPATRLGFAKAALHRALLALPCGSRVGLAVFTEHRAAVLLAPLEVCAHLAELRATLARIDGRMAWQGNSEVAKAVFSALRQASAMPGGTSVLFLTDGHEAPPLDPQQRPRFDGEPGAVPGVLLGVGGPVAQPIPRSDPLGRPLGPWAAEAVLQEHPYAQGRGGSVAAERLVATPAEADAAAPRAALGATPGREHLSALREPYLQLLAADTGLAYRRADTPEAVAAALLQPDLAHGVATRRSLRPLLAAAALALLLWPWRGLIRLSRRA